MKLFILYEYDSGRFPEVNEDLFRCCYKTISRKQGHKGRHMGEKNLELMGKLKIIYEEHFMLYQYQDVEYYDHTEQILAWYTSIDVITDYRNNIQLGFRDYVTKYLQFLFPDFHKSVISGILKDIFKNTFHSEHKYHALIQEIRQKIIPDAVHENGVSYDIKIEKRTMTYLPKMIFMMREIEAKGGKIYNVFPQRNDCVPHFITLDSIALVDILYSDNFKQQIGVINRAEARRKDNFEKIWKFFFKMDKVRKTGYEFHQMIRTDGICCDVIFSNNKDNTDKNGISKEDYIQNLPDSVKEKYKNRKIIAVDPGKSDLMYCVDGYQRDSNIFRYTQNRRRKQSGKVKFKKRRNKMKKTTKIKVEKGRLTVTMTIEELETQLSDYNRKTLSFDKYKTYLGKKNKANIHLKKFYYQKEFRIMNRHTYINNQRDEQFMINEFKEKFGITDPKEVVIAFGDFKENGSMKFKEPTLGIGMRNILRRHHFDVFLVDEYYTSKKCSNCMGLGHEKVVGKGFCENFLEVNFHRDHRKQRQQKKGECDGITRKVWGLVRCSTCNCIWNRDRNGANNIFRVAENALQCESRPRYLERGDLNQKRVLKIIEEASTKLIRESGNQCHVSGKDFSPQRNAAIYRAKNDLEINLFKR